MSAAASVEGCCRWPVAAAGTEEEGSAVRMDGSNSRVLSSVRGTFSASRFFGGCRSGITTRGRENEYTHLFCFGIIRLALGGRESALKFRLAFLFLGFEKYFFALLFVSNRGQRWRRH